MGQKVNPIGLRLGINRTWDSRGYSGKGEYGKLLHEDKKIRETCRKQAQAGGGLQDRDRAPAQEVSRDDPVGPPGRRDRQEGRRHREAAQDGGEADRLGRRHQHRRDPQARARRLKLVAEIQTPSSSSAAVAFRRAMKRAVQSAMRLGAEGIRINCGGRRLRRSRNRPHGVVPRGPRAAPYAARRHRFRRRPPPSRPTAPAGIKVWIFKVRDPGARSDGAG